MAYDRTNAIQNWTPPGLGRTQPGLMRVNPDNLDHCLTLYRLREELDTVQPVFSDHVEFVKGRPFLRWYFIIGQGGILVGSIYLTRQCEIGVQVFQEHQRKGWGGMAVRELMQAHKGEFNSPFLANINPNDAGSIRFWESLGFKLQHLTYAG